MKTTWDLSVLYSGLNDLQIEKDQKRADKVVDAFAKKYIRDKKHLKNPVALAKALSEYEQLMLLPSSRAVYYAAYRKELNVLDVEAEAFLAKLDQRGAKRGNKILYFALELGKIPAVTQKKFLSAKVLAPYRYWLQELFDNAKHDLSEPEEKILTLFGDVAHGRWVQVTQNILNKKTVTFGTNKIPLPEAEGLLPTLPTQKRRALYKHIVQAYMSASEIAESELNALYTGKKIEDELRRFKEPYEATVLGYQNEPKSVRALVQAVSDAAPISHRFYKAKAKLLGLKTLTYADRGASVGKLKTKVTFEKAVSIVGDTFFELDPAYADIFDRLLAKGQVDVYPRKGKTGGAFCSSGVSLPTYVLLNQVDDFNSLKTLAHEMGHAIHAERSKSQRPLYQGHPISTAETASTFFETAALNRLMLSLPKNEKIIALHDKIQDNVATVFRQIACFRFEESLHRAIREEGYVSRERIAALMNEHMKSYLGPAVDLTEKDGYFFVHWSHIRRFFYVYSYAYGQLISSALHRKLATDPEYIKKVDGFLSAGESMSPYDIFKTCGLDTRSLGIFKDGLKEIEQDVEELERLIR